MFLKLSSNANVWQRYQEFIIAYFSYQSPDPILKFKNKSNSFLFQWQLLFQVTFILSHLHPKLRSIWLLISSLSNDFMQQSCLNNYYKTD